MLTTQLPNYSEVISKCSNKLKNILFLKGQGKDDQEMTMFLSGKQEK